MSEEKQEQGERNNRQLALEDTKSAMQIARRFGVGQAMVTAYSTSAIVHALLAVAEQLERSAFNSEV